MLGTALRSAIAARHYSQTQLVRQTPVTDGQLQWNPAASLPVKDQEPLASLTAAIHLSGANLAGHRWTAAYKRELAASRIESTGTLANLLARLRKPPKALLVASAVGIYGNRGSEILDETSPAGTGFLAELCRDWEAATLPAVEAGIRVVHLRFGVILGPGSGALARMTPIFRLGLGGPLGDGRQFMSWISLHDAVEAILFAAANASLKGPVNLTAPRPVTNREFTRTLASRLQRPAVLAAPAFALRLALGQMADEALLASTRAYPARLATAGFQFTHTTLDEALAAALLKSSVGGD